MDDQTRKENVAAALALLRVLARLGAVVATGAFDYCDPCECFIAFPKRVKTIMRSLLKDRYNAADHGETWSKFESSFGYTTWELAKHSDQELEEVAYDLINDHRLSELEDLIVDRKSWATVLIP